MVAGRIPTFEEFLAEKVAAGQASPQVLSFGVSPTNPGGPAAPQPFTTHGNTLASVAPSGRTGPLPPQLPPTFSGPVGTPIAVSGGPLPIMNEPEYRQLREQGVSHEEALPLAARQIALRTQAEQEAAGRQQFGEELAAIPTPGLGTQVLEAINPVTEPVLETAGSLVGQAFAQYDKARLWQQEREADALYDYFVVFENDKQKAIARGLITADTSDELWQQYRRDRLRKESFFGDPQLLAKWGFTADDKWALPGAFNTYDRLSENEKAKFRQEFMFAFEHGYTAMSGTSSADVKGTPVAHWGPGARAGHEWIAGTRSTLDRLLADTAQDPFNWILPGLSKAGAGGRVAGRSLVEQGIADVAEGRVAKGVAKQAAGRTLQGTGVAAQAPNAILNEAPDVVIGAPLKGIKAGIEKVPRIGKHLMSGEAKATATRGMNEVADAVAEGRIGGQAAPPPETLFDEGASGPGGQPTTGPERNVPPEGFGPAPEKPPVTITGPDIPRPTGQTFLQPAPGPVFEGPSRFGPQRPIFGENPRESRQLLAKDLLDQPTTVETGDLPGFSEEDLLTAKVVPPSGGEPGIITLSDGSKILIDEDQFNRLYGEEPAIEAADIEEELLPPTAPGEEVPDLAEAPAEVVADVVEPKTPFDWIPDYENVKADLKWMDPDWVSPATGKPAMGGDAIQHVVTEFAADPERRPAARAFGEKWLPKTRQHLEELGRIQKTKWDDPNFEHYLKEDANYTAIPEVAADTRYMGEAIADFQEAFKEPYPYTFKHGDELIPEAYLPRDINRRPEALSSRKVVVNEDGTYVDYDPKVHDPWVRIETVLTDGSGNDLPIVRNVGNIVEHGAFNPDNAIATDARYYLRQTGREDLADIAKEARAKVFGKLSVATKDEVGRVIKAQNGGEWRMLREGTEVPAGWDTRESPHVPGRIDVWVPTEKKRAPAGAMKRDEMPDAYFHAGPGGRDLRQEILDRTGTWYVVEEGVTPKNRLYRTRPSTTATYEDGRPALEVWIPNERKRKPKWVLEEAEVQQPVSSATEPSFAMPTDPALAMTRPTGGLRTLADGLSSDANDVLNRVFGQERLDNPKLAEKHKGKVGTRYDGMTVRQVFAENETAFLRSQRLYRDLKEMGFDPDLVSSSAKTSVQGAKPIPQLKASTRRRIKNLLGEGTTDGNKAMMMIDAEWNKFYDQRRGILETNSFDAAKRRTSWDYAKSVNPNIDKPLPLALDLLHALFYRLPRHLLLADPITTWTYTMRNLMSNAQMMTADNPSWLSSVDTWATMRGAFRDDFQEKSLAAQAAYRLHGGQIPQEFGRDVGKLDDFTHLSMAGASPTEKLFTQSRIGRSLRLKNLQRPFEWKRNMDIRLERAMKIGGGYMPILRSYVAEELVGLEQNMIEYAARHGVPITADDMKVLWDPTYRDPLTGMIGRDDVYSALYTMAKDGGATDEVAHKFGMRGGRDWADQAKKADRKAIDRTNRIYPDNLKRTNADHYLSYVTMFHFWPTRAAKFMVEEMIRHPQLAVGWYRAHEGMARMAEEGNYPAAVKGLIRLWASPFGIVMYANPATLFLVTALQPEVRAQPNREGMTWLGSHLQRLKKQTGMSPIPMLDATLNMLGVYGDTQIPDILPSRTSDLTLKLYDVSLTLTGHHMHKPVVDQLMEEARQIISGHVPVPWGSGEIVAGDSAGYNTDLIGSMVLQQNPELQARMTETRFVPGIGQVPTEDAAAAQAEYAQIMEGDDPRYIAAERDVAAGAATDQLLDTVSPFPVRGKSTHRENLLQLTQSAREKIKENKEPTPEEKAAMNLRSTVVGSPEQRELSAQQATYKAQGTDEEMRVQQGWTLIAYGDKSDLLPGEFIAVNGTRYSMDQLEAMDAKDRAEGKPEGTTRQKLADDWVASIGKTELLEGFRDQRKATRANLPQYSQYLDWQRDMRDYAGGWEVARDDLMKISPGYRNYVNRLPKEILEDPERYQGAVLSMDAFLASRGVAGSIYDQPPGAAVDPSAVDPATFLFAPEEDQPGTGGTTGKPKTRADLLEDLTKARDDYNAELDIFNEQVKNITNGAKWEDLAPMWQESLRKRLAREGIDIPSEPAKVKHFREWSALRAEQGLPSDPLSYVDWLVEHNPELLAAA
jgi:hypothetical protein